MAWDRWLVVVVMGGGALVQSMLFVDAWVHRRSDESRRAFERLKIVEDHLTRIQSKASSDAGKWQAFIGNVQVRLALVEQHCRIYHGDNGGNS